MRFVSGFWLLKTGLDVYHQRSVGGVKGVSPVKHGLVWCPHALVVVKCYLLGPHPKISLESNSVQAGSTEVI